MFVPILVAARIRGIERRTIARLRDAGADTEERAILLEPGGRLARWVYRRLEKAQALRPGGSDRYYLHRPGYDAFRQRRRRRALLVLSAALIAMVILVLTGVLS
jgi:hypothetical protein